MEIKNKIKVGITKFECGGCFSLKTLVILGFVGVASIEKSLNAWVLILLFVGLWFLLDWSIGREVNNWMRNKAVCEVRLVGERE